MEIVLLGTGTADGWPNPFCDCASCQAARAAGEVRGQTAALVDGTLLLGCGPASPPAAARAGRSLSDVRHVLLTHAHPDHLAPAALRWRSRAGRREPIEVFGPPRAVEQCRAGVGPDDPVRLRPVAAGDRLTLGGYDVSVLAAANDGGAVLYDVAAGPGGRLLYATDTGPLPDATLAATAGASYDVVLLEETFGDVTDHGTGHLDLATFPRALAALRATGAVDDQTDVVAVHLSHRNPPGGELARRLADWGARLVPDGAVLATAGHGDRPRTPPASRRTLVLGGARSGKSTEAERALAGEPEVTYVATARPIAGDAEWADRVEAHRRRRPPEWRTVETRDVARVLRDCEGPVLVDCLTLWLGDALERDDHRARVDELVTSWRETRARVVAVSNEVGSGVVPPTVSGRAFRDELGRLNARLAAESDEVRLVVAGRVLRL